MKKLLFLLLSALLFGCVDTNVIEVKHTNQGYTSERIGIIEGNENDHIFVGRPDKDNYLVYRLNEDTTKQQFQIDFDEKSIKEVEIFENNKPTLIYENNEYKILLKQEFEQDLNMDYLIYKETYYYVKDDEMKILYEIKEDNSQPNSNVRTKVHPVDHKFLFFIKDFERNVLSICEVDDGNLHEIQTIDLIHDGYEYTYSYYYDNDFAHLYENEKSIYVLTHKDELLFDKNIENGYELIDFSIGIEIYLLYENEDSILVIKDDKKQVIEKYVDDYGLTEYYTYNDLVLYYEKDGYKRIVIDDDTYDLGYRPTYRIKKDHIISTFRNEEMDELQTIYVDRNLKENYLLSEYIDMTQIQEFYNYYLVKSYQNFNQPYSVLDIDGKDITMIDLPFSNNFKYEGAIDENQLIFTNTTKEGMEFYLVTLEE